MAIKVNFEGWLNEVKPTDWGAYATVAHDRRAKNDATGEWETVGKDYVDVSIPAEFLYRIEGANRVFVEGTVREVGAYLSKDGTAKAALKVRATNVVRIEVNRREEAPVAPAAPASAPVNDGWATTAEDALF